MAKQEEQAEELVPEFDPTKAAEGIKEYCAAQPTCHLCVFYLTYPGECVLDRPDNWPLGLLREEERP